MYVTKFTSFCQVLKRCTQKENCFLFFCLIVNSASISCLGLAVMLVVPVCFQGLLCIVQHTLIQCQHLLVFLDGQVRLSDEIAPAGRQQWNNAYSIIYLDTDTHTCLTHLCSGLPRWDSTRKAIQSGCYWSKKQWVAVASAGPYASLHLAPDR